MSIQSSDLFLVNRGGVNYKIAYNDLLAGTGVLSTDVIMVQRGGELYELSYADLGISGPILQSTDFVLVERGTELYSQRINGQLISAGAYVDLTVNVSGASNQSQIIKFGWTGGRQINGVPPQIVNAYNGKVAFLGSSGDVTLDADFCGRTPSVRVYGQFDEIRFNGSTGLVSCQCSTRSAAGWASIIPNPGPKMGLEMFDSCALLTGIDSFIPLRDMTRMFRLCRVFNDANASSLDTSQVKSMRDCFNSCYRFNQALGSWNTSSVEEMAGMFINCEAFDRNINNWATGNVTTFDSMFLNCKAFDNPIYLWDTSSVVSFGMNKMFFGATVFNRDLKNWCVSVIPNKPSQFSDNSALTQANEPIWGTCP